MAANTESMMRKALLLAALALAVFGGAAAVASMPSAPAYADGTGCGGGNC
jgi:hypothetical protein